MLKSFPSFKQFLVLLRPYAVLLALLVLLIANAVFFVSTDSHRNIGLALVFFIVLLLGGVIEITRLERNNTL